MDELKIIAMGATVFSLVGWILAFTIAPGAINMAVGLGIAAVLAWMLVIF